MHLVVKAATIHVEFKAYSLNPSLMKHYITVSKITSCEAIVAANKLIKCLEKWIFVRFRKALCALVPDLCSSVIFLDEAAAVRRCVFLPPRGSETWVASHEAGRCSSCGVWCSNHSDPRVLSSLGVMGTEELPRTFMDLSWGSFHTTG